MEHNTQASVVPLYDERKETCKIAEIIVYDSNQTESAIISNPSVNPLAMAINFYYQTKRYISNVLLWNINRSVNGQVFYSAEPVGCTIQPTESGLLLHFTKFDRKTPFRLFVTLNVMDESYSGVLYSPIPICNEEPKQNRSDIRDCLEQYATSSIARHFPRDLNVITESLEIKYYEDQENLLLRLLFGNDGYIDSRKEVVFLSVFKSYSELNKAMALIQKEYFKFNEEEVLAKLGQQSKGTFAIVFSTKHLGVLACHYKSGGFYPETKFLGYFAPASESRQHQLYYYRDESDQIVCAWVTPPNGAGFYQIEREAPLTGLRIFYTVDDWLENCVETKYPLE